MAFTDNFGHPKGVLGKMMITFMDKEHKPMALWALQNFEIPNDGEILDIGCGGGYNIKRMLNLSKNAKFTGFDISEESVKKAKKVNKNEKRVEIIQGSVEKMPFEDDKFDLITAYETVFFWPDTKNNIKEVFRAVKPQGRFVVINNYGDPNVDWEKKVPCMKRYTSDDIQEFMVEAGFKDIKVFTKDTYFCVEGYKI